MTKPLETLWYTHSPVPTGLGIAVQSGRLAEAFTPFGTNIQSLRESSEREVREAHYDHHLQNSVRHGGNIPAIWAYASGVETRVLGLSWSDEVQLILTTEESGVRSIRDLKNRRFGLPKWANVQIDFTRAQALRGLENALKLEGLAVADVELVDYPYGGTYSDDAKQHLYGAEVSLDTSRFSRRNNELIGLLRGDIDAIFLKGAHAVHLAHEFGPARGGRHRQPSRPADPQQQRHPAHAHRGPALAGKPFRCQPYLGRYGAAHRAVGLGQP
ncbi:ABC transporter [Pseudomonas monteilii]|uniref:ABC transporter n=1 Tax=Pseudomonas monteilii TaxID=76759 RepID=A0AAE6RAK2_9PSED|nr:ABC transporter [Pseudomonas monteilii]